MQPDFQPIETCPDMYAVLLFHPYYSHGRVRHGYLNRKGQWIGVNANGTEGKLNFDPEGWRYLPGDERHAT